MDNSKSKNDGVKPPQVHERDEKDRKNETKEAEPTKMRTAEQLMALYGRNCYLIVTGSKGDMPTLEGKSEREAVQDYERRKSARAYATIVCIPGPKGRTCVRGWIDSSRYRWDDDPESLRVVAHKQDETWRAKLDVVAKDVVVTDPCYFIKDELWSEFCGRELGGNQVRPKTVTFGGIEMLLAGTIYGDWMCELNGRRAGRKHEFGTFTADSGLVCVATFSNTDPRTVLGKLPKHCWTIIPQFTGTLSISHVPRKCVVRGRGRSNGRDVEFNSIQVG